MPCQIVGVPHCSTSDKLCCSQVPSCEKTKEICEALIICFGAYFARKVWLNDSKYLVLFSPRRDLRILSFIECFCGKECDSIVPKAAKFTDNSQEKTCLFSQCRVTQTIVTRAGDKELWLSRIAGSLFERSSRAESAWPGRSLQISHTERRLRFPLHLLCLAGIFQREKGHQCHAVKRQLINLPLRKTSG